MECVGPSQGGRAGACQHGLLPVPAPATVAILKGFRWHDDGVGGERVTSTGGPPGASDRPRGRRWRVADRDGTGAGSRDLPGLPNILRALVFSADASSVEAVVVLSFDVDDMTGEEIGIAADRLREADGVLNLTIGTRLGKKSRPAHDFRLLIKPAALPVVQTLCLAEMSTIGLRWRLERRVCLERSFERRTIEGKTVRIKRARRPDRDCRDPAHLPSSQKIGRRLARTGPAAAVLRAVQLPPPRAHCCRVSNKGQ